MNRKKKPTEKIQLNWIDQTSYRDIYALTDMYMQLVIGCSYVHVLSMKIKWLTKRREFN